MNLSLLQLNTNADNFWDKLTSYLTSHDFDILQLQEICGKETFSGNLHCMRDCYTDLQTLLNEKYHGELAIAGSYTSSPSSYIGNATFYKKSFSLKQKNILNIYKRALPFPSDALTYEDKGRALLHLVLEKDGKLVSFLNTHLAWAPTSKELPHQTKQGEVLVDYLKTVPEPFVLSGDFNLDPEQPLIQKLNSFARNLITETNITNTLNPRTHRANLFPPGLAVDYIFTSRKIKVKSFTVLEEDLSDHFGLITEIDV